MFAAQAVGDDGGETSDDEVFRVDQHPLLRHFRRLLREGFHDVSSVQDPPSANEWKAFLVAWIADIARKNKRRPVRAAACAGLIVELPNRVNHENERLIRKNAAKTAS
ncbi:MAG: hypothetical protein Rhirs2KO_34590 [Rhizobiaceae bacterium]